MAEYTLKVHDQKDQEGKLLHEHETPEGQPNKVEATITVTFDNPKWEEPRTETQIVSENVFDDDGELVVGSDGTPQLKDVKREVTVESDQPKSFSFEQRIFVPVDEDAQKEVCQAYADDYEEGFLATLEG